MNNLYMDICVYVGVTEKERRSSIRGSAPIGGLRDKVADLFYHFP